MQQTSGAAEFVRRLFDFTEAWADTPARSAPPMTAAVTAPIIPVRRRKLRRVGGWYSSSRLLRSPFTWPFGICISHQQAEQIAAPRYTVSVTP
jgi:hypothetical protein